MFIVQSALLSIQFMVTHAMQSSGGGGNRNN